MKLEALEIKMEFVWSSEGLKRNDPAYVAGVTATAQRMGNSNIRSNQLGMAFDAVAGGGFTLADFTLQVVEVMMPALTAIITTWIAKKPGRKVKLKSGPSSSKPTAQTRSRTSSRARWR